MSSFSPPLVLPLNGKVNVTVTRREGGQYVKGVWQANSPVSLIISASIQPVAKSTDTLMMLEGDRSKEAIKIYTTSKLLARVEGSSPVEGDLISWDGKVYEVMKVVEYKMGILNHTKAIAVKKDVV